MDFQTLMPTATNMLTLQVWELLKLVEPKFWYGLCSSKKAGSLEVYSTSLMREDYQPTVAAHWTEIENSIQKLNGVIDMDASVDQFNMLTLWEYIWFLQQRPGLLEIYLTSLMREDYHPAMAVQWSEIQNSIGKISSFRIQQWKFARATSLLVLLLGKCYFFRTTFGSGEKAH